MLQAGVTYDVLGRHHATNRRRRSPSPDYLDDVRNNDGRRVAKKRRHPSKNQQEHDAGQARQAEEEDGEPEEMDEQSEDGEEQAKKLGSRSKNKNSASPKPTIITFYPKVWRTLLDRAKARMRLHTAIEDAFPRLEVAVDGRCSEVLHEVIAYYKTKKWELDKSMFYYLIRETYLNRML